MKYLIVNGDDLGASPGINRGIFEAHHRGILTSASLMVDAAAAGEAADLSRTAPRLSVGLHADFAPREDEPVADIRLQEKWRAALDRQWTRFHELMGRPPTHLDSHHNAHRDPRLLPVFLAFARRHRLPLREHSPVCYFSKFYGQWSGKTHLDQISLASLTHMFATDLRERFTELGCHPGYAEAAFPSGYHREREAEVKTLCAPGLRDILARYGFQLISYHDLPDLLPHSPAPETLTAA
jgi:chitin disaccharide deacetylase